MGKAFRRSAVPASALLTILMMTSVTACSSGIANNVNDSPFDKSTSSTPPASGPLDAFTWYGDYRAPMSLDPLRATDYPELTVVPNICESLLRTTADNTIEAGLATDWKQVDPKTVRFTIRDGVSFSDGSPMTVDDVVYSLRRHLDPTAASAYSILYDHVESVQTVGATEVEVKLKSPNVVFLQGMATPGGSVVSRKFSEEKGESFGTPSGGVLCTGPYTVGSFTGTGSLTIEANPTYWDTARTPLSTKVKFEFPSDAKALANGIRSDTIAGGFNIPAELIPTLRNANNGKLWVGGEGSSPQNLDLIVSDLKNGPLADKKVRQALYSSIDRTALSNTAFAGAADPLYSIAGPGNWGYETDQYRGAYNDLTARANATVETDATRRADIESAGVAGRTVTLAYPGGIEFYRTAATILQQTGSKLGLDLEIVALPLAQYYSLFTDPATRSQYDAFMTMNFSQVQEPAFLYASFGTKNGSQNYGGYDNPEVDRLITEAYGEADDAARAKLVIAAQSILTEDLPWIPVISPRAATFQNQRLTGAPVTFAYMTMPWAARIGQP